jgi:hypothetical protein
MDDRAASSQRALDYPYEQPLHSYLQLGERTLALPPGGPDLDGRTPLLAYGANASPLALARKLARLPDSPLPLLRASLADFDVVYSAHLSPYGAVPATLHRNPGTVVTVFVAYPDPEQLEALNATEPNYELTALRDLDCRPELGRPVARLDAYLSRHGPLSIDSTPVALAEIEASGRNLPALTQAEVRQHAAGLPQPTRARRS